MRASKAVYHPAGDANTFKTVEEALDALGPFSSLLTYFATLTDPNADRVPFWDDSAGTGGTFAWLTYSGLTISGTVLSVDAATTSAAGVIEQATDAEVRASTAGNLAITASQLTSAAGAVALTDAATVAVDWTTGIQFTLTVTASRQIGNPSNASPGTFRTIIVQGDDATDRTITFDSNYLGEVPTITDCDSTRWYALYIHCVASGHFAVSAKRVKGT